MRQRGREALDRLDERAANALQNAENAGQRRRIGERVDAARSAIEERMALALSRSSDSGSTSGSGSTSDAGNTSGSGSGSSGDVPPVVGQGDRYSRLQARLASLDAQSNRTPFGSNDGGSFGSGSVGDGGTTIDPGTGGGSGSGNGSEIAGADGLGIGVDPTLVNADAVDADDPTGPGRMGNVLRERASAERNAIMERLAAALENAENPNQRRILSERAGAAIGRIEERLSVALDRQRGTGDDDPVASSGDDDGRVPDRMLLERIEAARAQLADRAENALRNASNDNQRQFLRNALAKASEALESRIQNALYEAGLLDNDPSGFSVAEGEARNANAAPGADATAA